MCLSRRVLGSKAQLVYLKEERGSVVWALKCIQPCGGKEGLTRSAFPVEMTENEKAAEYDKNVEYGDKHRGHGLSLIIL